ncbi:MAG TPA: polyprenyl synthetase family protein [Candidatus Baltobacteraceae bacterium]|jgi:geranylgeranyl diphosphate synthase type I|nr:polyprenyl synthetase family protein [Candidatus Baltobacteraceae bacterium]
MIERADEPGGLEPLLFTRHRALITGFMRTEPVRSSSWAPMMMSYHLGWTDEIGQALPVKGGKLIRSSLTLWACGACGGDVRDALPAACGIEWFHNATLVHDDIQDGDTTTRGAIRASAFAVALQGYNRPGRSLAATRAIGEAALESIEGSCLDLELEDLIEATPRMYLRMAGAKTGALLGACLKAGAVAAGASPERAQTLRAAGRLLGTAFQICDDVLGMYGDPASTGKSRRGDAGRYKMTFPVIAGIRAMSQQQRKQLRDLVLLKDDDPQARLRSLLDEVGAETLARKAALQYAAKSTNRIVRAGLDKHATNEFEEVAHYIATRTR